jgi:ribonuclease HII
MPKSPKRAVSLPPWPGRHYVGIDENGMGPRLGPMVVTSVLAETTGDAAAKLVTSKPRGAIAKRIGDSKKLVAFADSALGEAWARAIVHRALRREALHEATPRSRAPESPDELVAAVSIDPADVLRAPCPPHHADLCWGTAGEAFASDDATVAACSKDLDLLEQKGIRVLRARVAVVCTRRLNEAVTRGQSRFDVDLATMERLALAAREDAGAEVYALCGKVGGFDFYGDRFGPLGGWLHTTLVEGRARSEYLVPGVGRLGFVRDADETHMLVGLASLVGKWARDHLMRRVVRWHREHAPDLPDASGYHDPVTTRFIAASALVRKARGLEAACFERPALYKQQPPPDATSSEEPRPRGRSKSSPKASKKSPPPEREPSAEARAARAPRPS